GEGDDQHGDAEHRAATEELEEMGIGRGVLDIDLEQPGAADAIDHQPHGQGGEDGGDGRIGDQNAADETDGDDEEGAQQQGPAQGDVGMGGERQNPGGGHDHGRHHGEVDAPPDD